MNTMHELRLSLCNELHDGMLTEYLFIKIVFIILYGNKELQKYTKTDNKKYTLTLDRRYTTYVINDLIKHG